MFRSRYPGCQISDSLFSSDPDNDSLHQENCQEYGEHVFSVGRVTGCLILLGVTRGNRCAVATGGQSLFWQSLQAGL